MHRGGAERDHVGHLHPGRLGLGGEQHGEQQQRGELADRAGHDRQLAEVGVDLLGVAQHRHHDAKGAGGQGQREQPHVGSGARSAAGRAATGKAITRPSAKLAAVSRNAGPRNRSTSTS